MDWIKEMKEAMLKLQKACEKNTEWTECHKCPFYDYCPMSRGEQVTPDIWEID